MAGLLGRPIQTPRTQPASWSHPSINKAITKNVKDINQNDTFTASPERLERVESVPQGKT